MRRHDGAFHACGLIHWRWRDGDASFTRSTRVGEPLSVQRDDRRVTLAMDGALWMKKINKKALIVSEAMSSISAGVWLQSAPHNSLSIGKIHLLCWSCWQKKSQMHFWEIHEHTCRRRTCSSHSYHWNRPPFSSELKRNQKRPFISVVKKQNHLLYPMEQTVK